MQSARPFDAPLLLPGGNLRMVDRITGLWQEQRRIRAARSLLPGDWYFKAHFCEDPVQPGSLGIEAILQTAQLWIHETGLAEEMPNAEVTLTGKIQWKYRGQVTPANGRIETEVVVHEVRREAGSIEVRCEGWLWSDSVRIYHVPTFFLAIG